MKILIADDEPLARDRLRFILNDIDSAIEMAEARNGLEVLTLLPEFDPDIILMDIKMPGMDGLETARQISKLNTPPAIIYTTAYDEHALAAFDTRAIAYLLKPIRKEILKEKIDASFQLNKNQLKISISEHPLRTCVIANSKGKTHKIDIENICYFSADQKYVRVVYLINNELKETLIDETLKQLENDFSTSFIRVHHKTLVKTSLLDSLIHYQDGKFMLKLINCNSILEVSRRHVTEVKNTLKFKL